MDLALELGFTVDRLKREMSEGELFMWQQYAARKRLPTRRMENYLARLAYMQSDGKQPFEKFLMFERQPEIVPDEAPVKQEDVVQAVSSAIGSNLRVIDLRKVRRPDGY